MEIKWHSVSELPTLRDAISGSKYFESEPILLFISNAGWRRERVIVLKGSTETAEAGFVPDGFTGVREITHWTYDQTRLTKECKRND